MPERDEKIYQFILKQPMEKHSRLLDAIAKTVPVIKEENIRDVTTLGWRPKKHSGVLSDKQTDILHLVSLGLNNQQIAEQLDLSIETIKTTLKRIYNNLEIPIGISQPRVVAIDKAHRLGLI